MLYVAYGSNLNKAQMKQRCPNATVMACGTACDTELIFNRVATLHEKEHSHTPVALWNMSDDDEKTMDKFEGFPHKYHKEQVTVRLDSGKKVIGVAYIMNDDKHQAVPTDEYFNRILRGYKDFGFDQKYVEEAYDKAMEYEVDRRQMSFWDLKEEYDDGYCVSSKGITNEDCDLLYRGFIVGRYCEINGIPVEDDEIKQLVKDLSQMYNDLYYPELDDDFETFVHNCLSTEDSIYLSEDYEQEQEYLRQEQPTARYYAAYGSNMNKEQMAYRCPNSTEEMVGYAVDYKLEFCTHANIVPEENAETPVLLWKIDPKDWHYLDQYEGYPSYYRREEIDVDVNGERVKAIAYIMNDNCRRPSMPTESYLNNMMNDYKRLGLDPTPIATAMEDVVQSRPKLTQTKISLSDMLYDAAVGDDSTIKKNKKTQGIKV